MAAQLTNKAEQIGEITDKAERRTHHVGRLDPSKFGVQLSSKYIASTRGQRANSFYCCDVRILSPSSHDILSTWKKGSSIRIHRVFGRMIHWQLAWLDSWM
jgi:hypothetical protein